MRETQTSTLLTAGCSTNQDPRLKHHPCCSGLQVQGTAISPAARKLYNIFQHMVSPCLFIIPRKGALCQAKPSLLSSAFIGCFQLPFSIRLRLSVFIQQCHHFLRQLTIGTASILVRQISWPVDHPIVFSFPPFRREWARAKPDNGSRDWFLVGS